MSKLRHTSDDSSSTAGEGSATHDDTCPYDCSECTGWIDETARLIRAGTPPDWIVIDDSLYEARITKHRIYARSADEAIGILVDFYQMP